MLKFIRKHKFLTTIVLIFLIIIITCATYVFSKLNKLSYHDGTLSDTISESTDQLLNDATGDETGNNADANDSNGTSRLTDANEKNDTGDSTDPTDSSEEDTSIVSLDEAATLETAEVILSDADLASDKDIFNILLLGTDERVAKFSTNARADSIMILSLNKRDNTMKLVSLQRGMGFPILEGKYKGQYDWLTHLFRYGGADLMMKSIREVLNVDVQYYVRVNFNTFTQLIDSVGGVDVELTATEAAGLNGEVRTNARTKHKVYEGANHLDGYDALQYSRLRYTDSDWKRVQRQRNVIQAVVSAAGDMNLFEINEMLDTVLPLVQTNLTSTDILGLIPYVPAVLGQEFEQKTIPVKGTYGSMEGMGGRTLYAVDFQENSEILREFLYGTETER